MICENPEITGRHGKPPAPKRPPSPTPEPEIDLERLVWDPDYREQMRRRLKRPG